jgi:hypothetical protein
MRHTFEIPNPIARLFRIWPSLSERLAALAVFEPFKTNDLVDQLALRVAVVIGRDLLALGRCAPRPFPTIPVWQWHARHACDLCDRVGEGKALHFLQPRQCVAAFVGRVIPPQAFLIVDRERRIIDGAKLFAVAP